MPDVAADDSGELPPHLRPAAAPASRDAAPADAPRDAVAAAEAAEVESACGEVTPSAVAADSADQPDGAAKEGPSKAEILTRMDEVLLQLWLNVCWSMTLVGGDRQLKEGSG